MTADPTLFQGAIALVFALAGVTFFATGRVTAPYGRHVRRGFGPGLPVRVGWMIMESPSVVVFALLFFGGPRSGQLVPCLFACLWLLHYVHRTFIYPLQTRGTRHKSIPIVIVAMAIGFNTLNSYINAASLSTFGPAYGVRWLLSFRFLYGLLLFVTGFVINRWADHVLTRLRKPGETGYAIPRGGLFEQISCPNYFGELVLWLGWAIMTWSQAGLAFAVFTAANLVPRAVSHHNWYRREFPNYPRHRKAIIPHLL